MKNPPEVAIIVPTYNEERNIGELLESVQTQTLGSEVAVVDQQSTDRTVEIARAYGCVVVARPRPAFYSPPGQSRNYGVAATSARLLLHLDADMRLPAPDFLARLVRLIDDTHQAAVIHELDVASGFWGKCKALERRCYWHTSLESARAVTRTLFTAVGGYDAQISSGAGASNADFSFTESLARELARKGITVNAVAPGFVDTDMVSGMPEAALAQVKAMTPMGRLGKPEEIADAVVFLASPRSSFVTGQVLAVNGGMYM